VSEKDSLGPFIKEYSQSNKHWRVIVAGAIFYAVWFLMDARPDRTSSMLKYLGLAMLAGGLLLAAGVHFASRHGKRQCLGPLHKRAARLAVILLAVAVLTGFIAAIVKLT